MRRLLAHARAELRFSLTRPFFSVVAARCDGERTKGGTVKFAGWKAICADEAGEGVISTAIAVLIMALIGAAMWLVFSGVIGQAEERIRTAVIEIGDA